MNVLRNNMSLFSGLKYSQFIKFVPKEKHFHISCSRWKSEGYTRRIKPTKNRKNFREMGYILLVIPVAGVCLGTWQVRRRAWKLQLIEDLKKKTEAPYVDLPTDLSSLEDLEYCHVRVRGHFDHSQELYMMPRSFVEPTNKTKDSSTGLISAGRVQSGANVITAFQLADRNERILVNRGWVPRNKVNPASRLDGQVTQDIDLVGIVRLNEKRLQFSAANDAARNQWFNRDIDAMSQVLNTKPVWVDADWDTSIPGGPIGGQTRVTLRNEHMSYIFTWYSLAAITFAMWYARYWK